MNKQNEQLELEKKILGQLFYLESYEQQLDSIMNIGIDDFTNNDHKEMFKGFVAILINNKCFVGMDILFSYLKKYGSELSDITGCISSAAFIHRDVKELKAQTYHRKLINKAEVSLNKLKEAYFIDEIENAKNLMIADLNGIDFEKESEFIDFEKLDNLLMHNISNEKQNRIDGYSWGVKELDIYSNGILPSKLYVIGALKKTGKTRFAIHCLRELYQRKISTAFLSLEVPDYDFYKVLKASFLEVDDTALRSGSLKYLDRDKQNMLKELKFDSNLLKIECNNFLGINEVIRRIKRYAKLGARIIFVDYIQRINYDIKNSANELEYISKQLADITRALNISLILLCQLNVRAEQEIPSIQHLKGSGGIGEAADTILIFDNVFLRTKMEINKNRMDVEITQRYGESGKFKMFADLALCKFGSFTAQEYSEAITKNNFIQPRNFYEPIESYIS